MAGSSVQKIFKILIAFLSLIRASDVLSEKDLRSAVTVDILSESSIPRCTGIIVSSEWVLTTALCFCNGSSCDVTRNVRIVHTNLTYWSKAIVVHPAFTGNWWEGNLAMVKVANASWKVTAAIAESPEYSCPFQGEMRGSPVHVLADQPLFEYLIRSHCGSSSFPFHSVCSTSNCIPHLMAIDGSFPDQQQGNGLFRVSRDGWSLIGILGASPSVASENNCNSSTNLTVFVQLMPYVPFILDYANFDVLIQRSVCGDGLVSSSEQCDDGNVISGDGCDHSCSIEAGYVCDSTDDRLCTQSVCTIAKSISTYKAVGILLMQTNRPDVQSLQRAMAETLGIGLSWVVVENMTQLLQEKHIAVISIQSTIPSVIDRWDSMMKGMSIPLELSIVGVIWAMDKDSNYIVEGSVTNGWNTQYLTELARPDNRSLKLPQPENPATVAQEGNGNAKSISPLWWLCVIPFGVFLGTLYCTTYARRRWVKQSASLICEFPAPPQGEGELPNRTAPVCQAFVGIGRGAPEEMAKFFQSTSGADSSKGQMRQQCHRGFCTRDGCACNGGVCACQVGCNCARCMNMENAGKTQAEPKLTPAKAQMPSFRAALFNPYWGSQIMNCGRTTTHQQSMESKTAIKEPSAPVTPGRVVRAPPASLPMPPIFTPPHKSPLKSPPPVNPDYLEGKNQDNNIV